MASLADDQRWQLVDIHGRAEFGSAKKERTDCESRVVALESRLLGILLDNAIKYTPEHGEIHAEVAGSANEAVVMVRDREIGISPDIREQIFDRFYQADLRERKTNAGCGLGLSIARWIADAHRAEITVTSASLEGSVFKIRFTLTAAEHSTCALEHTL
jgi:two-component system heavy metal sensor histidine kinase CusS